MSKVFRILEGSLFSDSLEASQVEDKFLEWLEENNISFLGISDIEEDED